MIIYTRACGVVRMQSPHVLPNLPSVNKRGDNVRPLLGERKRRRPPKWTAERPNIKEVYVPRTIFTTHTNSLIGKGLKHARRQNLADKMADNNCCYATLESPRDFVYLSPNVRSPGMKGFDREASKPNKRSNRNEGRRRL